MRTLGFFGQTMSQDTSLPASCSNNHVDGLGVAYDVVARSWTAIAIRSTHAVLRKPEICSVGRRRGYRDWSYRQCCGIL